jgi:hypothetical protein
VVPDRRDVRRPGIVERRRASSSVVERRRASSSVVAL